MAFAFAIASNVLLHGSGNASVGVIELATIFNDQVGSVGVAEAASTHVEIIASRDDGRTTDGDIAGCGFVEEYAGVVGSGELAGGGSFLVESYCFLAN